MKRLLSIVLFCVLGFSGNSFALPPCLSVFHNVSCTYTYSNEDKYVGEWKDNNKHGQGTYTTLNGKKYVGEWKDDIEWNGILYDPGGTVKGKYTQGVFEPRERFCVKKREYVEDGKNMIDCEFADGERYVGATENGSWNGHGTYISASGAKYVGEWKDDLRHGHGTYIFTSGHKYVGGFKYDKPHSQGTLTWADGSKYVGGHKDGKQHGQGTKTWSDGSKYVGEWEDGLIHGQGTLTYTDGDKYVGDHKDGKQHGQGTYTWADGDKYVGENRGGPWDGIKYFASGKVQGTYSSGKWCGGCKPTARQLAIVDEIESGQIATAPQKPTLTVKSNPTNANIYIDNKYKGKTELKIQLAPDYYSIRVSKYGYNNFSQRVGLDKNMVLWASLSKITESKPDDDKIVAAASGSGFFVSRSGHIITNHHVIEECKAVKVSFKGNEVKARVLAIDKFNDLAILKTNLTPSNVYSVSNEDVQLLQDVVIAGYPLGKRLVQR